MMNVFDLQLFADDTNPAPAGGDGGTDPKPADGGDGGKGNDSKPTTEDKKYSDADVDRIVNERRARWEKEQATAIKAAQDEAAKLAKMNEAQKQQYELEKQQKANEDLQAEIEKLKQERVHIELSKTAASLLQENGIDATDGILNFVVGKDAESTKTNIDAFVKIVEAQVKKAEVARATGSTPKVITHTGNTMSEIDKRLAKYQ